MGPDRQELNGFEDIHTEFKDGIFSLAKGDLQIHAAVASNVLDHERINNLLISNHHVDPRKIRNHPIDRFHDLILVGEQVNSYLLTEPKRTGNESDAVYFCDYEDEDFVFLGQYIQPHKVSSHHRHQNALETFFNKDGDLFIWHDEREAVKVEGVWRVQSAPHVAFALDRPALSFIVHIGEFEHDASGLKRPSIEFLQEQARLAGLIKAA